MHYAFELLFGKERMVMVHDNALSVSGAFERIFIRASYDVPNKQHREERERATNNTS